MTSKLSEGVLTLSEYQYQARKTAIYPEKRGQGMPPPTRVDLAIMYCALKLNGEAGELAEKVGKVIRDDESVLSQERRVALAHELGDVLWYVANLARELGYDLEAIGAMNLNKLASRKTREKLGGSGDDR